MTVTYDFVNIPSSPVRIDIPRLDQTKISRGVPTIQNNKDGSSVVTIDYKVSGTDALTYCTLQQRYDTWPKSRQFAGGFDRGVVSSFSLKLSAPMTRDDSASDLDPVTEMATATIAVNLPMGTTDLYGLMDFMSSVFGLVIDSIDGTSHEPLTANLFDLATSSQVW